LPEKLEAVGLLKSMKLPARSRKGKKGKVVKENVGKNCSQKKPVPLLHGEAANSAGSLQVPEGFLGQEKVKTLFGHALPRNPPQKAADP